jgi:predicted FMN-binding regulatory protein PaiB
MPDEAGAPSKTDPGATDYEGKPEDDESFWARALEWLKGVPREMVEKAMNAQQPPGMTPVPAPAETEEISEETKEEMELTEGAKGDKMAFDFEEERRRVAAENLKKEQEQEEAWKNSPATGGGL